MHTSFIGIKAAQSYADFLVWERFLTDTDFARIIEIGTYKWGMSLFFWLWCKTKAADFHTYDIKFFPATRVIRELGITKQFQMVDVFEIADKVGNLISQPNPTIVYCDGGNKAAEIKTFSRYLKKGDYIAMHDFGTEVFQEDIPKGLKLIDNGDTTRIYQYA